MRPSDHPFERRLLGPSDPYGRARMQWIVAYQPPGLNVRGGETVERRELMHLEYKTHVSQDAETGIVTSIKLTTGCSADNKQMVDLVRNDEKVGVTAEFIPRTKGTMMAICIRNSRREAGTLHSC